MSQPPTTPGLDVRSPGRRWRLVAWPAVGLAALAVAAWWTTHPAALPTSTEVVTVTTPVDHEIYVGLPAQSPDSVRVLQLRGVEVLTTGDGGHTASVLTCRGGSIAQTTEPTSFCTEVTGAEGTTLRLGGGDQLMLRLGSSDPGTFTVDEVRVSYRDGLQWATQPLGGRVTVDVTG